VKAVDAVFGLRVENEDEVQGLDVTGQFQRGYLFGEIVL
jgi:ammonia channel protein AmtB